jgi:hypothetical protein
MSKHLHVRALILASLLVGAAVAIVGKDAVDFRIRDNCDPATFNAAVAPGTCIGNGDTTFAEFLDELTEDGEVGSWRFNPDETRLDRGQRTILESRGGELHTFTKVENFGGGLVPVLNDLGGFGATVPECVNSLPNTTPDNFVVPAGVSVEGPKAGTPVLPRGTTKWQCCIHPWMRSEISVR